MSQEQYNKLFDSMTTSDNSNDLIAPLYYKDILSQYGKEGLKAFSVWFVKRRKDISY